MCDENQAAIKNGFTLEYLIAHVHEDSLEHGCSFFDSIDGIAEGHELPTSQIDALRLHFKSLSET